MSIYLEKSLIQKDAWIPVFIAALFTIVKHGSNLNVCEQECVKKWYTYSMKYYSTIEKNETTPFAATWMDLEIIVLNEVRERQIPYDITYKERK